MPRDRFRTLRSRASRPRRIQMPPVQAEMAPVRSSAVLGSVRSDSCTGQTEGHDPWSLAIRRERLAVSRREYSPYRDGTSGVAANFRIKCPGTRAGEILARHRLNKSLGSLPDSRFIGSPVPGYEIYRIVPTFAVEYITLLRPASWKLARNTCSMSVREGSPHRKRENGGGPDYERGCPVRGGIV